MRIPWKELLWKGGFLLFSVIFVLALTAMTEKEKEKGGQNAVKKEFMEMDFYEELQASLNEWIETKETQEINTLEVTTEYLRIKKQPGYTKTTIEENWIERQLLISVDGVNGQSITETEVERGRGQKRFLGTPSGSKEDVVKKLRIKGKKEPQGSSVKITATMDHVYVPEIVEDDEWIYVMLRRPREVYDKILVIDAGHGGTGCGTYSIYYSTLYEKEINLLVVQKLKEHLDAYRKENENLKIYYTRTTDETIYLSQRVDLANDVQADIFLSVHCNADSSGIPYGTEALYGSRETYRIGWGKKMAELFLADLTEATGLAYRTCYERNDLYILGHSEVPACLVELGFLTDTTDRTYLESEEGQKVIAKTLFKTIKKILRRMESDGTQAESESEEAEPDGTVPASA